MMNEQEILIVSQAPFGGGSAPIWGSGGWLPPDRREDLDWFTLIHLLGWSAAVTGMDGMEAYLAKRAFKWVIFACPPEAIGAEPLRRLIGSAKESGLNIVLRQGNGGLEMQGIVAGTARNPESTGHSILWQGPGGRRVWELARELCFDPVRIPGGCEVWATVNDLPLVSSRPVGNDGRLILLGFHPSECRDLDGVFSSLLKHLLIFGRPEPVAWIEWSNSMMLRMDDPGSSETVHNDGYADVNKLNGEQWNGVRQVLKRHGATLTVGYVSGWVDDGIAGRGTLKVDAVRPQTRVPGKVYPSPRVQYIRHSEDGEKLFDYREEFAGLLGLVKDALADIAAHGYTHIFPDFDTWLAAPDAHVAEGWFREFGQDAMEFIGSFRRGADHPLHRAVNLIQEFFGFRPAALINPGEVFTDKTQLAALELGFRMISSYYTALRVEGRFCWVQHVCAPYLNEPSANWFAAELPVIGYFHDFDISRFGADWLDANLEAWKKAGASRFYRFKTFSDILEHGLQLSLEQGEYVLECAGAEFSGDAPTVGIKFRPAERVDSIIVRSGGKQRRLPVKLQEDQRAVIGLGESDKRPHRGEPQ